jgi:hypothetical protein
LFQDLGEDDSCLVLSGVNGTILKLIVQALYTGQVIVDGRTQLRQFEAALRSLNSFGILLNLRAAVHFADSSEAVVEAIVSPDEADAAPDDEVAAPDDEVAAPDDEVAATDDEVAATDDDEVTYDEPLLKKQPERPKPRSKRKISEAEEAAADEEINNSPRKRTRASLEKAAAQEANKPDFDNVTIEMLNEKVEEGHLAFVRWLQTEGFLRKSPTPPGCSSKDCSAKVVLKVDKEAIDGVSWQCQDHAQDHGTQSVREGSIFGRRKASGSDSLSWIIQIILCWSDNTSLHQCQQLTGADVDKIFVWYDECRDYYGPRA